MPAHVLYYIRHGETDWNVEVRLQGRHDVPLNARGRAQARDCAAILRDTYRGRRAHARRSRFRREPARPGARDKWRFVPPGGES